MLKVYCIEIGNIYDLILYVFNHLSIESFKFSYKNKWNF